MKAVYLGLATYRKQRHVYKHTHTHRKMCIRIARRNTHKYVIACPMSITSCTPAHCSTQTVIAENKAHIDVEDRGGEGKVGRKNGGCYRSSTCMSVYTCIAM